MIIVGLFGFIGAGKDAIADYLVAKYGFHKITMSDIVIAELKKLGRPVNRDEMQKLSKEHKQKYGGGVWARKCVEHAERMGWQKVVISGMRDSQEVPEFSKAERFIFVFVDSSQDVRFRRLMKRGSEKDVRSRSELLEQEKREIEIFDLYRTYPKYSDYTLVNNGTYEELKKEVDRFVEKYGL